ncbi:MAG TPA: FAD:protein FMN transferase [Pirellulaceae bacterium]|nr:FAD:protein FMN transferase [Pirellulaceae bacterium]
MTTPRKSTRRQFLSGRAAIDAVENLLDQRVVAPRVPAPPPSYLLEVGRKAMACEFHVYLNAGQHADATDHAVATLDLVDQLEDQLTVYREHSEICRLNRLAYPHGMPVEGRLFALLQLALQLHHDTNGAFDITAGPITKLWGFYRREGRMPGDDEIAAVLSRVGSQYIELDATTTSLRFTRAGMELNLGGIGKGYALDRCAERLAEQGVENYLLHGGQSSIVARGSKQGLPENERGWSVALRHPLRDEIRLGEIWLREMALGTSGTAHQFFYHQGKRYAHILDPRTARPAEGLLSTTVLAPTAAEADALATAFFVLGVEGSLAYCATRPEIGAILIAPGDRSGALEVHSTGLSDDVWRPYA